MDFDIDSIVSNLDFKSNSLNNVNGLLLTNKEIEVLNRYEINYKSCITLKEVIRKIEDLIEEVDDIEELDSISQSISERDYYQNTNK